MHHLLSRSLQQPVQVVCLASLLLLVPAVALVAAVGVDQPHRLQYQLAPVVVAARLAGVAHRLQLLWAVVALVVAAVPPVDHLAALLLSELVAQVVAAVVGHLDQFQSLHLFHVLVPVVVATAPRAIPMPTTTQVANLQLLLKQMLTSDHICKICKDVSNAHGSHLADKNHVVLK